VSDIEKAFNYSDEFSGDKLVVPLVVAREHVAALTAENARLKAEVASLNERIEKVLAMFVSQFGSTAPHPLSPASDAPLAPPSPETQDCRDSGPAA